MLELTRQCRRLEMVQKGDVNRWLEPANIEAFEEILISQDICTNKDHARIAISPAIVAGTGYLSETRDQDEIDHLEGSD